MTGAVMDRNEILRKAYRVNVIIGFSMVVSLLIYLAVIQFATVNPWNEVLAMKPIFYLMSIGSLFAILFLKNIFLQKKFEDKLQSFIAKLNVWSLITYALCEAPALYGLVLYFIGSSRKDFYVLAAYSLLLFAIFFPRFNQWEEYTSGVSV